jgi:nicotinate (nicotinamide) nucleotide adenylyltransferase
MQINKQRIGILGGAFDPIHRGHLALAQHCLIAHALDAIRFVPTAQPILKQACSAKPWQRAAMVELAIAHEPRFYLDLCELQREAPSYALLTVQDLRQAFPQDDLFWILGQDAFADFTKWYRWQDMASLCDLLVVARAHDPNAMRACSDVEACFIQAGHQVIHSTMPLVDVASRLIRVDVESFQSELPEAVQRFIIENNLYTQRPQDAG